MIQMHTKINKAIRSQAFAISKLWIILVFRGHMQPLFPQTTDDKSSCPSVAKQPYIVMLHQSE